MSDELGILFSGGSDSLALYAMALSENKEKGRSFSKIHLINILNGMSRFPHFTENRYQTAKKILEKQSPETLTPSILLELDCGRLFQELWLDRYEKLMPLYNGKNLVCLACKLAMHTKAIIYGIKNNISEIWAGYSIKQSYYPEQTPAFMESMKKLSAAFGIKTEFPVYEEFSDTFISRHFLEDLGLPSTGGGERKCLFSQTKTSAKEREIRAYLNDMEALILEYIKEVCSLNAKKAALVFSKLDS